MINLPNTHYTWFSVSYANYLPLYLNLDKIRCFLDNSKFVEQFRTSLETHPAYKYRELQTQFIPYENKSLNLQILKKSYDHVHLSPQVTPYVFTPQSSRTDISTAQDIWLPSERFFWDFAPANLGSSRHIILHTLQLKGSGRNPMAVRPDQTHAWGGSYLWENLKAITFNHTYRWALPLGLLEVVGVSIQKDEFLSETQETFQINSVLLRESKSYRLTQIMTGLDPNSEIPKEDYQNFAKSTLEKKEIRFPESYYFQYGSMLALGILDLNITKENVMFNGALIDYEDVSYKGDNEFQEFEVKFLARGEVNPSNAHEYLASSVLFTSNYHLYLNAIEMTQKAQNKFLEINQNENLSEGFINFIKKFSETVYTIADGNMNLIKILSAMKSLYVDGIPYYHLPGDQSEALSNFILKHSNKEIKVEPVDKGMYVITYILKFNRGRWKDELLQDYYESINLAPISKLATPILKLASIQTSDKHQTTIEEALTFSSKVNEVLSKNSWILPYKYDGQKFDLQKIKNQNELDSKIIELFGLQDLEIESYQVVVFENNNPKTKRFAGNELSTYLNAGGKGILQGVIVNLNDFKSHFVGVGLYLG